MGRSLSLRCLKAGIICSIALLYSGVSAQDVHFSQFYASPLTLNPALTGHFICDWRAAAIYRDQWRTISPAMMTAGASFDKVFYFRNQKLGGGAVIVYDNSGNANLTVTKIFLSGAYHKKLGNNTLSAGLQMGFVNKKIDNSTLTFPEQWNQNAGHFDSQLQNFDSQIGDNLKYFDMNVGAVWSLRTEKLEPQVGVAFFHITRPKESFYKNKEKLKTRHVIHAGLKWNATNRFFMNPNLLYQFHASSREFVLGSNFGYRLTNDKFGGVSIWAGPMFRYGLVFQDDGNKASNRTDAIIAVIGAGFKNIDVGFAYDINMTDLKNATKHQGAFELSVIYTSCKPKLDKEQIPCDRL